MSNIRARSLPRVREALEKAERARFYKQRTNKYTDEVRLVKALTGLENERIAALARIKEQTMDLRMQALHIKDEEKAFLEADSAGLEELKRKFEVNKQRNFLQEVKYKPRRIRDDFVRRYECWKVEDAEEDDWREEMPRREPKVRLNDGLIYPTKRERKQNRRQYMEITKRPDSKLGAKAVLRLLLLLLLLVPATVCSAKCKLFSVKTDDDNLMDYKSKQEAELRVWTTMIAAQYSPAASKLIVLFRTPPSRDKLDQVKLEFDLACDSNPKTYHLVSLNSTESVGKNLSLVTVDRAYLPTDTGSLCLHMEVFTYQNGDPVKPRVFSAMAHGCYVNLDAATSTPRPSNQSTLPSPLAQLLMHRYSLVSTDSCCLQYVGPATRMPPPLTVTASQPLSPQLVTGLYVLVGALCLLCLLILAWLGHKLVVSVKNFKSTCKARCRELALQRQLRFARPSVVRLEQLLPVDLAGPPYQHLLTHCKSVRTRQRIAGMRPTDAGRSNA